MNVYSAIRKQNIDLAIAAVTGHSFALKCISSTVSDRLPPPALLQCIRAVYTLRPLHDAISGLWKVHGFLTSNRVRIDLGRHLDFMNRITTSHN